MGRHPCLCPARAWRAPARCRRAARVECWRWPSGAARTVLRALGLVRGTDRQGREGRQRPSAGSGSVELSCSWARAGRVLVTARDGSGQGGPPCCTDEMSPRRPTKELLDLLWAIREYLSCGCASERPRVERSAQLT